MAKLQWHEAGKRTYETGVDMGVLYPVGEDGNYEKGVAWNGLTSVNESPSGAEDSKLYADNINYLTLKSAEEYGGSIECYTYPDEWKLCDGSKDLVDGVTIGQQERRKFGLVYRTILGNDTKGDEFGYKIHVVYGCSASPSEKGYQTKSDNPEAITFSYEFTSTPVSVTGHKPTSIVTIDSTKLQKDKLEKIEKALFGSDEADAKILTPDEIKVLIQ